MILPKSLRMLPNLVSYFCPCFCFVSSGDISKQFTDADEIQAELGKVHSLFLTSLLHSRINDIQSR